MFYNCEKISYINFSISYNNVPSSDSKFYFYPNDLSYTFYNCISLTTLEFYCFKTDKVKEIRYMLFNCKKLTSIPTHDTTFSNPLIKNMKGMFQNCESLTLLDLSQFHTKNVEIMWDMFKGCKSLTYLNLQKFRTSKVIDNSFLIKIKM